MTITVLLLLFALAILIIGAELLVRGATTLARSMGVSGLFIGLTVVAFGTSTPELATSVIASWRDIDDVSMGNVVGSNIFNVAVILAVAAVLRPIPIHGDIIRRQVPIVIVVALVPCAAFFFESTLPRWFGGVMLCFLVVYVARGYSSARREAADADCGGEVTSAGAERPRRSTALNIALIAAGVVLLAAGAHWFVQSSVEIAQALHVSDLVIGLTIVAAGTSAPELITSVMATLRGRQDLSVGNILGSNIFNILGILGVASVVSPQQVSEQVLRLDVPVMLVFSLACLPIMLSGRRVSRAEGVLLLFAYTAYLVVLLVWAPEWFSASGG